MSIATLADDLTVRSIAHQVEYAARQHDTELTNEEATAVALRFARAFQVPSPEAAAEDAVLMHRVMYGAVLPPEVEEARAPLGHQEHAISMVGAMREDDYPKACAYGLLALYELLRRDEQ